jgi:hypothetical protein
MPMRTVAIVLVAVAVAAVVVGMIASSLSATEGTHSMPDGNSMRDREMP